jgi:hypothetical protein
MAVFKNKFAQKGAGVFYKSIIRGVFYNLRLVKGVKNINFKSILNIRMTYYKFQTIIQIKIQR